MIMIDLKARKKDSMIKKINDGYAYYKWLRTFRGYGVIRCIKLVFRSI